MRRGQLHVMGGDQGGKPGRPDDRVERRENMAGGFRIEIAGRLVGKQKPRAVGDRAGDRDALLLAAGQFGRPVALRARQGRDNRSTRARALARLARATARAIICGSMTFSSAENSGSR